MKCLFRPAYNELITCLVGKSTSFCGLTLEMGLTDEKRVMLVMLC